MVVTLWVLLVKGVGVARGLGVGVGAVYGVGVARDLGVDVGNGIGFGFQAIEGLFDTDLVEVEEFLFLQHIARRP